MKRIIFTLGLLFVLYTTGSCNFRDTSAIAAPIDTPALKSETVSNVKQVGEEMYGYFLVPADWVVFQEVDPAAGDEMIQYSDLSGQCIITVRYYENPKQTPEERLQATASYMQSIGSGDVKGYETKLNGIGALQVEGTFSDGTAMVAWAFLSEDKVLHHIIAEAPVAFIDETADYLTTTYSIEK